MVVPDRDRKGGKGRKSYETNEEPGREGEVGIEGKEEEEVEGGEVEQNVPFSLFLLAV